MKENKKNIEYLSQWEPVRLELMKYILYFIKDEDAALDILQSTTEISYKKYKGIIDSKIFKYQLLAIAKNKIFEHRRKKIREFSSGIPENTFNKGDTGVEIDLIEQESLCDIISALDDLEQQFIVLRYKEALSYKDISKVLGKSEGALRTYHHRLIRKLNKIINVGTKDHSSEC